MLNFTKDLPTFIGRDFGQAITIDGVAATAIFDNGTSLGDVGLIGMASTKPAITMATSSVPANPIGKTVVIDATSWEVASHEPDGLGVSRLELEATA
jgi:hypothetical protein